jgi:hypothetical protein
MRRLLYRITGADFTLSLSKYDDFATSENAPPEKMF